MRKMLFAVALLASVVACTSPKHDGYIVKGNIAGITEGQAVIINNTGQGPVVSDTAEIKNGKFEFRGKVVTPEIFILIIGSSQMPFFLDNSTITITGDIESLDKAEVKGSKVGEAISAINDKKRALQDAFNERTHINELLTEYRQMNTTAERRQEIEELYEALRPEIEVLYKEFDKIDSIYITENPSSPYTVMLVYQKDMEGNISIDKLSEMLNIMLAEPELADNRFVVEMAKNMAIRKGVEVGRLAPDFVQNDTEGNPVTFSDVYKQHKITMIDFWASWCAPCRVFNPTLLEIYQKYQPKGLEIIGVSLDRNHGDWLRGIEEDKLPWLQVSDVQFWDSEVAKLYYVRYIPQNVFVDAEGNILAKQLDGEGIEKFLEEHLK